MQFQFKNNYAKTGIISPVFIIIFEILWFFLKKKVKNAYI
jgi:hypothetical protein